MVVQEEVREVDRKTKEEKRRSVRVEAHIPVKYHTLKGGPVGEDETSLTMDLGEGGVCFRTAEFISMACRLILELDIPVFSRPVRAITKVAWIRRSESGDDYEVGNQFLEMTREDRKMLSEYVRNIEFYRKPAGEGC